MQAEAAGIEPDVRMNPILLKPTTDVGSQVIVNGHVQGNMPAMEYYRRKRDFIPAVMEAYESLAREYDIIVIEGAGSPAEINLQENDIVNMGLARMVDAPVLLVGDIDRGGVFASLYGTVKLLDEDEQARIRGLVINKFRGDVEILRPGLTQLEELTGTYPGVEKSYAIQAGREVRIMVKPEDVSEDNMVILARELTKKIESELEYPGQIKVNVIRESRAVEYAK